MKFFVGTYTGLGGPGACVAEAKDGKISLLSACRAIDNPNYLILAGDGQTLYAAASSGKDRKGAVAAYRVRGDELLPLSLQLTGGTDTCHLTLSPDEGYLYAANYGTGSVSAFPVKDGYIMPRQQLIAHGAGSGVFPGRQDAAHTHFAVFRPGTNQLFVCDLGMDEIVVYAQDEETGMLTREGGIQAAPGCGPRHIWFESANRFYLACELSSEVKLYTFDNGAWTNAQTLSTLPEGISEENTVAAIRAHRGGLYLSNRGYDSVAQFDLRADGFLSLASIARVAGRYPRDILPFDEDSVLTANQFGETVEWLKGGKTVAAAPIPGAVCLLAAPQI